RVAYDMQSPSARAASRVVPRAIARYAGLRGRVLADEINRILDGNDLLGRIVRDLDPELLLERHHQLDGVEAVGAQIVDEAGPLGDLGLVDPEMLDDNLLNTLGNVAHGRATFAMGWRMESTYFASRGRTGSPARRRRFVTQFRARDQLGTAEPS